ncbi:hypothetical protein ACFSQ7_22360 [Paenibacillus rhizoplanae]
MIPWQWMCIMIVAALNYSAICMGGVYASSTSGDLRAANQRVSLLAYPLSFLFVICLSVIGTVDLLSALIISCISALIYLWVISRIAAKIWRMKQPDFFQPITIQKAGESTSAAFIISSAEISVWHGFEIGMEGANDLEKDAPELCFFLCFSPVAMVCLLLYFYGNA